MGTAMGGRTLNVAALLLGAVCFVLSFRATQAQSAPVFTESVYYRTRDENIGVNTLVVTVRAEDADGDAITYSIINTTSSNFIAGSRIFSLGASTGEIRTAAYLDREQADWFLIHISATDGTFTSYAQAYFLVRDLDDVRPVVRLLEPALAFHESELPVDIARTAKLEDGDTILYEIQQFSLTLRSYDGTSYPRTYGFCDNATADVFSDYCGISLAQGSSLTNWTLVPSSITIPPGSNGKALSFSSEQYALVNVDSLYPLGPTFTFSCWFSKRSQSAGSDFQYLFAHTSVDGSLRYTAIARLRATNRILFLYVSNGRNVYVWFELGETPVDLEDNAWHFISLSASLSSTASVASTSATLQIDRFRFSQPQLIRTNRMTLQTLPPFQSSPDLIGETRTQISGRPNSDLHSFDGIIAQPTFWKGVSASTEQNDCVLSCGDRLVFSSTSKPFGITDFLYDGRSRTLSVVGTAPAGQLQPLLRSVQYTTQERPPRSRLVDILVRDTQTTSIPRTLELLYDEVPRSYRPSVDLNGELLPGSYFEAEYLEDQAVGVNIVSTSSESPARISSGAIGDMVTFLLQVNITLQNSPIVDFNFERLSVNMTSLPAGMLTQTVGSSLLITSQSSSPLTSDFETVVRTVQYWNTNPEPTPGDRHIIFTLENIAGSLGYENLPKSFATVTVVTQNDAPVLDLDMSLSGSDVMLSSVENGGPISVMPRMTITDSDSQTLEQFEIDFTPIDGDYERYILGGSGVINRAATVPGSGRFHLLGEHSVEVYRDTLRTLQWSHTKQDRNTTTGYRNLTMTAYDDFGRPSNTATAAIFFQTVDDPPTIQLNPPDFDYATTYTEERESTQLIPANINITDPDTHIAYATVRLASHIADRSSEVLTFNVAPVPPPFTVEISDVQLTIRGVASTDMYQQVLSQVYYRSSLVEPNSSYVRPFDIWAVDTTNVSSKSYRNVSSTVTVISLNDNNPLFERDCSVRLHENLLTDRNITTVYAVDSDFGSDGVLLFTFTDVRPVNVFRLDSSTGEITNDQALDFETHRRYWIDVNVTDGGTNTRSNFTTCVIDVLDVNDNLPFLDLNGLDPTNNNYMTTFVERNETINLVSQDVILYDVDTVSPLIHWVTVNLTNGGDGIYEYLIITGSVPAGLQVVGNGSDLLNISGPAANTSFVSAIESIMYVHSLSNPGNPSEHVRRVELIASDGELQSSISTSYITFITVNDIPVSDMNGDGGGRNYNAIYMDTNGTEALPITDLSNGGFGLLDIDNVLMSAASITLSGVLDAGDEFLILSGPISSNISVSGNGTTSLQLSGRAAEAEYKQAINLIRYLNRRDEANPNGVRHVTLTITDGGHRDNRTAATLTSEPVYTNITIATRNDHFPIFQNTPYVVNISEDAMSGIMALTVFASDADRYITSRVTYTIINDGTNSAIWALNSDTGAITLDAPSESSGSGSGDEHDIGPLNYEVQPSYRFYVQAADGSSPELKTNISVVINIIDINDNTPRFQPDDDSVIRNVPENITRSSTIIDFNAFDADSTSNSNLSFWFFPVGNSFSADGRLYLNPLSGVLSNALTLDREDVASYSLQVMVRDAGVPPRRDLLNLTINVIDRNDNPPVFDPNQFTVTLDENTVPAQLKSLPLEAQARWLTGLRDGTYTRQVAIRNPLDPNSMILLCDTMAISGATVMLTEEVVMATDSTTRCFSMGRDILFDQMTSLTILNNVDVPEPLLAKLTISDSELSVDWLGLYNQAITDAEKPYRELYTFFKNESLSVQQRVARAGTTYSSALNGATFGGAFACPLVSGSWSTSTMVNVLTDIQSCSSNFTTGNLGATWDSPLLQAYTGTNDNCVYAYGLTDQLDPPLAARVDPMTVGLKVFVRHNCTSNDVACLQRSYDLQLCGQSTVPRGMRFSNARVPIDAYDRDLQDNGRLEYSINAGNDDSLFAINQTTGVLNLVNSLDYEQNSSHILVVGARDHGVTRLSAQATVVVAVNDVNDNAPNFTQNAYTIAIDENMAVGTTVLTLSAIDRDSTSNGLLAYAITMAGQNLATGAQVVESLLSTTFRVETRTVLGEQLADIIVSQPNLDFEVVRSFYMTLQATDAGTPALNDTVPLVISLNDVNDNRPLISVVGDAMSHLEDENRIIDTKVFRSINISDADTVPVPALLIQGVRITVTSRGNYAEEYLYSSPDINATYPGVCVDGGGAGTQGKEILLEGGQTQDLYETILSSLFYENFADEFLYNDTATFQIWITDEPSSVGAGMCGFDRSRNFTSVTHVLNLQEVNDRPRFLGTGPLTPLPTIDEDPLLLDNQGRPVWQLVDSLVSDNDDILGGSAVYGLAIVGVTGTASGLFEYTNNVWFTGGIQQAGVTGSAVLTVAWDSSITLNVVLETNDLNATNYDLRVGSRSIGRLNVTRRSDTNTTAIFYPGQVAGEHKFLLGSLENSTVDLYMLNDMGVQVGVQTRLTRVPSSLWRQVRNDSSPVMTALIGSGGRFRFQPAQDANGMAEASLLVWDQRDGSVGTNAFDSSGSTSVSLEETNISVTVRPVNDPPSIRLNGAAGKDFSVEFIENIDPVAIVNPSALTVDDVENDIIVSVLVNIYGESATVCNSSQECPGFERSTPNLDRIFYTENDLFETGFFNVTGTICKTWNLTTFHTNSSARGATEYNWQTFLRTAQFYNQHPEPYNHIRIVEFRGFDGKAYGPPAYAQVNVTTFNDNEPRVSNDGQLRFVEGDPCSAIGVDFTVIDPDCSATLLWVNITLEGETDGGYLRINATGNVTAAYNGPSIYLSGRESVDVYQAIVKTLLYYNTADEPSNTRRMVAMQVRGRVATSDNFRFEINPRLISDAPPVLQLEGDQQNTTSFFEENSRSGVLVIPQQSVNITDMDDNASVPYTVVVTITNSYDGVNESLQVTSLDAGLSSVISVVGNGSSSLTITSMSADLSQFITALSAVEYFNMAQQPLGPPSRLVSFVLEDRENTTGLSPVTPCGVNPLLSRVLLFTSTAYSEVIITPRNDLPEVYLDANNPTLETLAIAFNEGGPPVSLTAGSGGNIIDLDNLTLEYLEVSLQGAVDLGNEGVLANVSNTNINITLNTTDRVLFTGPDTIQNFIFVLNSLTYNNDKFPQPTNGTRNATIVVSDGIGVSAPVYLTIVVDIFNNNPILDLNGAAVPGQDNVVNFVEGGSDVLLASDGTVVDTDSQFLIRLEAILTGIEVIQQEALTFNMGAIPTGINCEDGCGSGARVLLTSTNGVTVSSWQTLLRTFRYVNRDDELNGTSRSVIFTVTDDKLKDDSATTTIIFNNVADVPIIDLDRETRGIDFLAPNEGDTRLNEQAPVNGGIPVANLLTAFPQTTVMGEAATVTTSFVPTTGPRGDISVPAPPPPPSPPSNLISTTTLATTPTTPPTTTPTAPPTTTPTTPPTTTPTTPAMVVTTTPFQEFGRKKRQAPLGEASLSDTSAPAATTESLTTSATTAGQSTTAAQSGSSSAATSSQASATTSAVRVPITFQQMTTVVGSGERGYTLSDTDSIYLKELDVAVSSNAVQYEQFDILNGIQGSVTTSSRAAPSLFEAALRRTFSDPVIVQSSTFTDTLGDTIAHLERFQFSSDNVVVFCFSIVNGTVEQYENLLGLLRYRNEEPEPCCASSPTSPTVSRALQIFASDNGVNSSVVATSTVTINLLNDNPPIFSQGQYDVRAQEDVPAGRVLLNVTVTDADTIDLHNSITFNLTDSSQQFVVRKVSNSVAEIVLEVSLNRETFASHMLNVSAFDGQNYGYTVINITVVDTNDNTPVISNFNSSVVVPEGLDNALVTYINVTDIDEGLNGEVTITIFPLTAPFEIVNNRELRVQNGSTLDREATREWNLTLLARDRANSANGRTSSVVINVTVGDINDNAPVFFFPGTGPDSIELRENIAVNSPVYQVLALDADIGINAVIVYQATAVSSSSFTVNSATGAIILTTALNFESVKFHTIVIEAQNLQQPVGVGNYMEYRLTVNVTDVNDNDPVFDPRLNFTVAENTVRSFGSVLATDVDTQNNITYAVVSSPTDQSNLVQVDMRTGALTAVAANSFDREQTPVISFRVSATDSGNPRRTSFASVFITLTDINDNNPMFNQSAYTAIVLESIGINDTVATVLATDRDAGDNMIVRYSLRTQEHLFSIDPITGVVFSISPLNYDLPDLHRNLSVEVLAEDQAATGSRNATVTLTVTVVDINDNDPVFGQPVYTANILENAANQEVVHLDVTDIDSSLNGALVYNLTGVDASRFRINATGTLYTDVGLDRERLPFHNLTVFAFDRGTPQRWASAEVFVSVDDENDYVPAFQGSPFQFTVDENAAVGTLVASVVALDDDTEPFSTIAYAFSGIAGPFSINITTGAITLEQSVDYEVTRPLLYQLDVTASDGKNVGVAPIQLEINDLDDNFPVIGNLPATVRISETVSGAFFMVNGSDADGSPPFNTFTFRLVNDSVHLPGAFSVGQDGSVSRSLDLTASNFPNTSIGIQACGTFGTCSGIQFLRIEVNRAPVIQDRFEFMVHENTVAGVIIGTVIASDINCGDNNVPGCLTFVIVNDTHFSIDNSGVVRTTSNPVNRERVNMLNLTVSVADSGIGAATVTTTLIIRILDRNDVDPCFEQPTYNLDAVENVDNLLVRLLQTTDSDLGNNSQIEASLFGSLSDHFYAQHYPNGSVAIFTNTSLDRETIPRYTIGVQAVDMGDMQRNCNSSLIIDVIDVNDNCPMFSLNDTMTVISINEFAPIDFNVLQFTVTDDDAGSNQQVSVSIAGDELALAAFRLTPGQDGLLVNRSLDPESALGLPRQYSLTLVARDGSLTNPCTTRHNVSVLISDENDNMPQSPDRTSTSVIEENGNPQFVAEATFTDPDFGPNGLLNYSLAPFSEGVNNFTIHPNTSRIFTVGSFDREIKDTYILTVYATDNPVNTANRFLGSATVTVSIQDINDQTPQFMQDSFVFNILENATLGTYAGTVNATDGDIGINAEVTYSLSSHRGSPLFFSINNRTGSLETIAGLDRERYPNGVIYQVNVTDRGSPQLSSTAEVRIMFVDVNDNRPIIDASIAAYSFLETAPLGFVIGTVRATDADIGDNGKLSYFLLSEHEVILSVPHPVLGIFRIDTDSGDIILNQTLDFENISSPSFIVRATSRDNACCGNSLEAVRDISLRLTLRNVNDNPPVFTESETNVTIPEDAQDGRVLATLSATDRDQAGQTATPFLYRIISSIGRGGRSFRGIDVGFTTGIVTLGSSSTSSDLDYEVSPYVTVLVIVTDVDPAEANNILTSTATVSIFLTDINDNAPVHRVIQDVYQIDENQPVNTSLTRSLFSDARWSINDADGTAPNNVFDTFVAPGMHTNRFFVDREGYIRQSVSLDNEAFSSHIYVIQLYATDRGVPPMNSSLSGNILVYVNDLNDHIPAFQQTSYTTSVLENATVGSFIFDVTATDGDRGGAMDSNNNNINISLVQNGTNFSLTYNGTSGNSTGYVYTNAIWDRETLDTYTFTLLATDGGVRPGPLNSSVTATVTILDVDDNRPLITSTAPPPAIVEGASPVRPAQNVIITDADLVSLYPIQQLRVALLSSTGATYPNYGGNCAQAAIQGAGRGTEFPYDNALEMCGVSLNALDLLDTTSNVCGTLSSRINFPLVEVNSSSRVAAMAEPPLLGPEFVLSFWFRAATSGTLLSRYGGGTLSLEVQVTASSLVVLVGYSDPLVAVSLFTYTSVSPLDDVWHHFLLELSGANSLAVYYDGIILRSLGGNIAEMLTDIPNDNSPRELFVGGAPNCSSPLDGSEISFLLQAFSSLPRPEASCCIASCGNILSHAPADSRVSVQANCAQRSLQYTAAASLQNSDSLSLFNQILQNTTFQVVLDEILIASQNFSISARDTVGFGSVVSVPLISSPLNDRAPELYLGGQETLNYSTSFTEGSANYTPLAHQMNSALIDRDTLRGSIDSVEIEILNPGTRSDTLEHLRIAPGQLPASLTSTVALDGKSLIITAATTASYNDFLTAVRAVQYINGKDEPSYDRRTVQFRVNDGINSNSPLSYTSIDVFAVNDAPLLDLHRSVALLDNNVFFQEDGAPLQLVENTATLTDSDNSSMASAVATLVTTDLSDELQLNTSTLPPSITSSGFVPTPGGGGTLTFNGVATIGDYLTALRSVLYFNGAGNPPAVSRRVEFIVSDGPAASLPRTVTIVLGAINDIPVVDLSGPLTTGLGTQRTFTESGLCVSIADPTATITDVDSTTLIHLKVTLENRFDGFAEAIRLDQSVFALPLGLALTYENTTSFQSITIDGTATLQTYTNLLRAVVYCNNQDEPDTSLRSSAVLVIDSGNFTSATQKSFIQIQLVNDAPRLSAVGNPVFVDGQAAVTLLDRSSIVISDPDSANMAQIIVELQTRYDSSESVASPFATTNSSVTESQLGLVYNLNFNFPIATTINLLHDLVYNNLEPEPSVQNRNICIRVGDGQALSNQVCIRLSVMLVNEHTPVFVNVTPVASIVENLVATPTFDILADDADAGVDGQVSFEIFVESTAAFTGVTTTTTSLFTLNSISAGRASITVNQPLDAERYTLHTITITAADNGPIPYTTNTTLTITVVDANDVAPVFPAGPYTMLVSEGLLVGDVVTTVAASDADVASPQNRIVQYSLLNNADRFAIDNQGVVRLRVAFDFAAQQQFIVTVRAQDGGTPALTANSTLNITLQLFPPCFINTTTSTWIEGTRSQALSPSLTIGCRSRVASVTAVSVALMANPTCSLQLCQLTQRLPACELDESNFPVVRLMDLARGKFNLQAPTPAEAHCGSTGTAVALAQNMVHSFAILDAGTIPDLAAAGDFTIAARFRLDADFGETLFAVNNGGGTRWISVYFTNRNTNLNHLFFYYQNATTRNIARFPNVTVFDRQFHHVVITVSNSLQRISLYVDCQFSSTINMNGPMVWDSTREVYIGTRHGSANFGLDGVIDDVLIQPGRLWTTENINCMCSDSSTSNCGETIERPPLASGMTARLEDFGRTLTLTGTFGFDVYETAMRSIRYRYIAPISTDISRQVTFSVTDDRGGVGTNASSISIIDTNTNLPPTLLLEATNQNKSIVYDDQARGAVPLANTLTLDDLDNANLATATVSLTGQNSNAGETLGVSAVVAAINFITPSANSDNTILTLTATGGRPIGNFQTVLRTVTYSITGTQGTLTGTPMTQATFSVTDTGNSSGMNTQTSSATVSIAIQVTTNRNSPSVSSLSAVTFSAPAQLLAANARVTDVDTLPLIASITVQISTRPTPARSGITGLACERYPTLLVRSQVCTSRSAVNDFLFPAPVANAPLTINTTVPDGNVAFFTGRDFYLSVTPAAHNLEGVDLSTFTISVWFRQSADNEGYILSLTDSTGDNRLIGIYSRGQLNQMYIRALHVSSTTSNVFALSGAVDDGNWHHLVLTFSSPTITLYIDGILQGTQASTIATSSIVPSAYRLYIGARPRLGAPETATFRFSGEVAGVNFWSGSVSASQVRCIYQECLPSLTVTTQAGITSTYSESGPSLVLSGSSATTLAQMQSVLRTVQYENELPAAGPRVLSYTASDSVISSTVTQNLN